MAKVLKVKGLNHVQKGKERVLKQDIKMIWKDYKRKAHITGKMEEAEERDKGKREMVSLTKGSYHKLLNL